jgi:TonB family protein
LAALGNAYLAQRKLPLAKSTLERAVRIADGEKFQVGTYFQDLFNHAARLYRIIGQDADALAFERRAASVVTTVPVATSVPPARSITKASVIPNSCRFEYPREAILYELTGEAHVRFSVDVTGQPQNVVISKSSGWGVLDKATLDGFSRCRFTPAMRDGKPTQVELANGYRWTLDSETQVTPPEIIRDSCLPSNKFAIAMEENAHSTIRVRFLLDPEGKPYRTVIEGNPFGPDITTQAIQFVESCRYQPTIFQGKAVPNTANMRLLVN